MEGVVLRVDRAIVSKFGGTLPYVRLQARPGQDTGL
jgi:hypothetical protein